ncbi:uncharacterized protein C2845_PM15G07600 [Panicum miliaceum]|uniref:Uncharacterized protein n=1 Tax=Panicum miliaceum TaxID=4540 RepID=A0A3L6QB51_PANMI|nr:uncharacterized protein C2845_PM15G07600 [Panicum miliaceum]
MPQLDLDHFFCVGARGHGESMCETAPASDGAGAVQRGGNASASARADDGDAPAESVLIPVRGGAGLGELLCAALRRDGSTKGGDAQAAGRAAGGLEEVTGHCRQQDPRGHRRPARPMPHLLQSSSRRAGCDRVESAGYHGAGDTTARRSPVAAAPGGWAGRREAPRLEAVAGDHGGPRTGLGLNAFRASRGSARRQPCTASTALTTVADAQPTPRTCSCPF